MKNKIILLIFVFLLTIIILGNINAIDMTNNIVGYWNLNQTTGDATNSYLLNYELNGTWLNRNVTNGIIENGQFFNNNGHLNLSNNEKLRIFNDSFTINFWFNMSSSTGYDVLFSYDKSGGGNGILIARNANAGKIGLYRSGTPDIEVDEAPYEDDKWHMLTFGRNTTAHFLYLDGNYNKSVNNISGDLQQTNELVFGRQRLDSSVYFLGAMDEIGIWERSLNNTDISDLYNSGSGLPYDKTSSVFKINLLSPENNEILSTDGTNFSVSFNITGDTNSYVWDNATYYIWYSNTSLFNSTFVNLDDLNNLTYDLFIDDFILGKNYLWNVLACYKNTTYSSCLGFLNNNLTFINLPFSEKNVTFNQSVFETSSQTFSLPIIANPQVDSVTSNFYYNGTKYVSILSNGNSGEYIAKNTIDIPLQNVNYNKTFFWEFNFVLDDGTSLTSNSSVFTQEVNRTFFGLCNSTLNTKFINFTTKNAENPFPILNATFKSSWSWYLKGGTGSIKRNYTFEDISEGNSTWNFCAIPNQTIIVSSDLEYDATNYALNFYYLENAEINNQTQSINLYLLNDSKATITTLKVVDESQNPITNALIQIQFYDVGTGSFYLVGMGKTDFKGEDLSYLNWYDSLYKFIIIKDGSVIKTTNTTRISSSTLTFNVLELEEFLYNKFKDFLYSLYFNDATNNFVLTFTKPSGLVDQGCLRVIKRTGLNDTEICFSCETSTSATLYCNLNNKGNGTFIAHFYATGSYYDLDWIVKTIGTTFSDDIYELLGVEDASFYAFILAGIVTFMFFIHPIFGVVGVLLGILGANVLGFAPLDYGIFTGIVLIGGIIIWIIKR